MKLDKIEVFWAFCDSLYHDPFQIMKYEIFVINIIIKPKNIWENPMIYSGINRWYSNKIRHKKEEEKSTLTMLQGPCFVHNLVRNQPNIAVVN